MKTLNQGFSKFEKILSFGIITLTTTFLIGVFYGGIKLSNDMKNADAIIKRKAPFGNEIIGAYDANKDGYYERIIVNGIKNVGLTGSVIHLDLTPEDDRFERYKNLLNDQT